MNRATVTTAAVVVLVSAQAAAAGFFWWQRQDSERALTTATTNVFALRRGATGSPAAPLVETAPANPRWRLHESNDVPATMQLLESMCDGEGVAVDAIKAATTNAPGKQSFVLTVRGAPRAVCSLLAAIENHECLLVVESGRVRPAPDDTISMEMGVTACYRGGAR